MMARILNVTTLTRTQFDALEPLERFGRQTDAEGFCDRERGDVVLTRSFVDGSWLVLGVPPAGQARQGGSRQADGAYLGTHPMWQSSGR